VCDTDPASAAALEQAHSVPALDFASLLATERVGAVAIATPSASHYALARAALRAGRHVFVEKPLALELDHARELVRLAEATGRVLMVGHICLYHPAFRLLERMVAGGAIGRMTRIHATRLKVANGHPADDVLSNLATHDVAMVLALIGAAPRRVTSGDAVDGSGRRERVAAMHVEFDDGRTADIFAAHDHGRAERRFTVLGERGSLTFDDLAGWDSKLVLARDAGRFACPLAPEDALEAECAEFLASIDSGGQPRSAGDTAVEVVRTLERARRAGAVPDSRGAPLLGLDPC
jgi:predicted dehydrogenase